MNQQAVIQLINEFRELRSRQRAERLDRMERFIVEFEAERPARSTAAHLTSRPLTADRLASMREVLDLAGAALDTLRRPARFNVFSLLRREQDEVIHTQFLAWLLDRRGGHGQGSLFARAFLDACGIEVREDSLRHYHVRPEFSGLESIIDVMVCRPHDFLIYVENKICAGEGWRQAEREIGDMRRLGAAMHVPTERQLAVLLTPEGRPPVTGDPRDWVLLSYPDLADAIAEVLPAVHAEAVRLILEHWLATVRSWR